MNALKSCIPLVIAGIHFCGVPARAEPDRAPPPTAELLWLADSAPMQRKSMADPNDGGRHAPTGSVEAAVADVAERAMNHADAKRLWLRSGPDPMRAPAVPISMVGTELRVLAADGRRWTVSPISDGGRFMAPLVVEEMGFYNAYLTQAAVSGGRLEAQVAKAEVLKGTCCKKGVDPQHETAISDPAQPIELVRDHMPDEKLFTRLVSGDKVTFTVHSFGKPLAGAAVTLSSLTGWRKTVQSDAAGRVQFTLIRDYFPAWTEFRRLTRQTFLVTAEADVEMAGEWQDQPFTRAHLRTSLAGKYSPSPYDYRSYAIGLGICLGVATFLGTAIYLYRRRRVKPFQEVRFDGKA